MNDRVLDKYNKRPKNFLGRIILTIIFVGIIIWSGSAIEAGELSKNGLTIAKNIFLGIFNPDKELLFNLSTTGVPYLLL